MRTPPVAIALVVLGAGALGAQGAPVPCRASPCALVVDWGVSMTMNDMPPDRKYGSPAEFDAALRETLRSHEMTAVASAEGSKVSIRVQAAYKTGVLCEDMPGTMPDRSCATIGEAIANFGTSEPGAKLPASVRMINRCGASGAMMSMKQFGRYTGEMIWYTLEGEKQKASKPMGKC